LEVQDELPTYLTPSGKLNVIELATPKNGDRAILCIHGFCCDGSIFKYAADKLVAAGYDVYCVDLPGHGLSDGPRGDLEFDSCLRSIEKIVSEIRRKSSKVFLLAHSMGSTFALWYARQFRNSIDGLVLLSPYVRIPGIKRSDAEPGAAAFLYLFFGRVLCPKKRVDIRKVLPGYVRIGGSQYARMVKLERVNFEYSFRYLIDIVARRNGKLAELADIQVPVFIVYGLQDRNVYPQVSEEFFKLLKCSEKQIASFDCNHWFYDAVFYSQAEEYGERERTKFIGSIIEWMESISLKSTERDAHFLR
jgi:alpha-beta hydrolase superfamily lysophospholipase